MPNPFRDQEKFMKACDQQVGQYNQRQYDLYRGLIAEEFTELNTAVAQGNRIEELDALIDILVVVLINFLLIFFMIRSKQFVI